MHEEEKLKLDEEKLKLDEEKLIPDETSKKVQKIVIDQLGVKEEQVNSEANFANDLGADSLDTVELVMALEEEFDIDISDDAAEKIKTVKDAVDYIKTTSTAKSS